MTALAVPARPGFPLLAELLSRQRLLARYGIALLLLALVAVAMQAIDPRTLASGVNVWVKPAKFLASVGVFALTAAWFFGYVREERRRAPLLRGAVAALVAAGTLELVWITWQGANGLESHFNFDSPFYRTMFNLMGVFAVLLIGTTLPLAWEIARRPAPGLRPDFVAAVATGLVLTFLLGTFFGMANATNAGHAVGLESGRVPLFGWNRSGGDLRIAHFVGVHSEQAVPLLAAALAGFAAPLRWVLLAAGTFLWIALAFALYLQASAGMPLLPL